MDQSQQIRRQQVPPEYLKEVVVRYILSNPVSAVRLGTARSACKGGGVRDREREKEGGRGGEGERKGEREGGR